jgi:hypothetical protein
MSTDWKALCAELADALDAWQLGGGPPEDTADADLIARARTALAQPGPEGLPPRVGHILRLAEIIREVDGSHDKGAAALAEAILSHSGSRWSPTIDPVPVSERPWEREGWCDAEGMCWWWCHHHESWELGDSQAHYRYCLPRHALPIPTP